MKQKQFLYMKTVFKIKIVKINKMCAEKWAKDTEVHRELKTLRRQ